MDVSDSPEEPSRRDTDDRVDAARAAAPGASPFCVHLRSKKLLFADGPPMDVRDVLDASRHCWCRHTMQIVGPDHEIVDPRECQAGRSCFESIL
jgi:hypothetical protein